MTNSIFVHPGPARSDVSAPDRWAPVVHYATQMQAVWWAWQAAHGRTQHPRLRLLLGAGAGLAPLHHELVDTWHPPRRRHQHDQRAAVADGAVRRQRDRGPPADVAVHAEELRPID